MTTDEIIDKSAPSHLVDHNLVGQDVESLCGGCTLREASREAPRRLDGRGAVQRLDRHQQPEAVQLLHDGHGQGADPRLPRASVDREVNAVVFTGTGDKAFCTGGTRRSTRSITPATRRSTAAVQMRLVQRQWSPPSSAATSR